MKLKLTPIFKSISLTFITEAIVLIAFFFIYRLIAKNFGAEGIGEYALIKRIIAFLLPVLLLGFNIGLPRYIAMSQNKDERIAFIKTGGLVVIVFTFIFLIFINLFKIQFAQIFFGSSDYINLVLPFSFFLLGLTLHVLIYSYFQGKFLVTAFNIFQVINLSLVPVGILFFLKNITIEKAITLIGITTFTIAFIFSLFFIKDFIKHIGKQQLRDSLKKLLHYSLPRVPGGFIFAGLFSLGPIFAAHSASIKEVGYLSLSQSLLISIGTIVSPLSIILLPKITSLINQKREEIIKENINFLIGVVFQCFIFISVQLLIFTDVIMKYWLGPDFINAVPIIRIVFASIVFYAFYITTRRILDAVKVKPLNTINLFLSLVVFLIIGGVLLFLIKSFSPIISLGIAFSSAMIFLGTLTYVSIRKIYPEGIKKDLSYLLTAIVINLPLGIIAIFTKPFIISRFYYLIAFEILIGIIYLSILWLLKIEWIRQIPKKIFQL